MRRARPTAGTSHPEAGTARAASQISGRRPPRAGARHPELSVTHKSVGLSRSGLPLFVRRRPRLLHVRIACACS